MSLQGFRIGFFLATEYDGRGGLENVLIQVNDSFKEYGIDVFFFFLKKTIHDDLIDRVTNCDFLIEKRISTKLVPKVLKYQLNKKIDQFNVRNYLFNNIKNKDLDVLMIINLPDILINHRKSLNSFYKKTKTPIGSWIHGSLKKNNLKQRKRIKGYIDVIKANFCISNGLLEEVKNDYQQSNCVRVFNPISDASLIPRGENNFIYIGRVGDPNKRVKELLLILKKLTGKWHLDIYGGTGTIKGDQLFGEFLIENEFLDSVTFHGWVNNPWEYVKKADVLLLHSLSEGFPLVLAEAMMRGIPCVSSDCPTGPNEIIIPDVNGWLYAPNDNQKLQEILQDIIDDKTILPEAQNVKNSVQYLSDDVVILDLATKFHSLLAMEGLR